MAASEAGVQANVTQENFGELFLLAYADHVRTYDTLERHSSRLKTRATLASRLAVESLLDEPDLADTAISEELKDLLSRTVMENTLAEGIDAYLESTNITNGFRTFRTEKAIVIPQSIWTVAEVKPEADSWSILREDSMYPVPQPHTEGHFVSASLTPSRSNTSGNMSIMHRRRIWDYPVGIKGIIDRTNYASLITLSFGNR